MTGVGMAARIGVAVLFRISRWSRMRMVIVALVGRGRIRIVGDMDRVDGALEPRREQAEHHQDR